MKCPYCHKEMKDLPLEAIRASFKGHRMIQVFDLLVWRRDEGMSISDLVEEIWGSHKTKTDAYNITKVIVARLKDKMKPFGWTIDSGVAIDNSTERVYRFRPLEEFKL